MHAIYNGRLLTGTLLKVAYIRWVTFGYLVYCTDHFQNFLLLIRAQRHYRPRHIEVMLIV